MSWTFIGLLVVVLAVATVFRLYWEEKDAERCERLERELRAVRKIGRMSPYQGPKRRKGF